MRLHFEAMNRLRKQWLTWVAALTVATEYIEKDVTLVDAIQALEEDGSSTIWIELKADQSPDVSLVDFMKRSFDFSRSWMLGKLN